MFTIALGHKFLTVLHASQSRMVHITPALVRWDVPDFLHPIPTTPAADRNIHHLLLALTYDPIHLLYIN